ncbi:MAG TPA: nuclear transport factor 2 family protein [Kiloniellaceae bacterium]|nr:nuclear transport factor 2 family protein [Kiloniellaceae bacterium]
MHKRIDEGDEVIAVAAGYYAAMIDADEAALRRLFHPRASVVGNFEGTLEFSNLDDFIASTADAKSGDKPFDCRVDGLVLVGDTAVVTLGGYCYGTWFTDHLSLVKIDGAWRIVAKTFYAQPPA